MQYLFRKFVCLFVVVMMTKVLWAQAVDDIPLFLLDEEKTSPAVDLPQPVVPSKPISFDSKPKPNQPNIGRDAQPLTKVEVFPPPAPTLDIKIPQPVSPKVQASIPKPPINSRIEAIALSKEYTNNTFAYESSGVAGVFDQANDVRGFELEGFYLGMTPDEIIQIAKDRNYKITSSKNTISKFRAGYYESLCKSRKIYLPADIRACINEMSQKNDTTYLAELKIARPKTRDFIEFYFTSPATDNRLWKMVYQNKGDNSLNFTRANTQKKIARRDAFLNAVYDKFGNPDNAEKLIWGSENDAFMQIGIYGSNYDAYITLTDVFLSDDDYFEAEDWRQENQPFERFGFED